MPAARWPGWRTAGPPAAIPARLGHIGVAQRAEVDRLAEGVPDQRLVPETRRQLEPRGVAGGHRPVVVGLVGVDQAQALDRVAGLEQLLQHDQDAVGMVAVRDQLTPVDPPVQPPVVHPQQPQVPRPHRTPGPPRPPHPGPGRTPAPPTMPRNLGATAVPPAFTAVPSEPVPAAPGPGVSPFRGPREAGVLRPPGPGWGRAVGVGRAAAATAAARVAATSSSGRRRVIGAVSSPSAPPSRERRPAAYREPSFRHQGAYPARARPRSDFAKLWTANAVSNSATESPWSPGPSPRP